MNGQEEPAPTGNGKDKPVQQSAVDWSARHVELPQRVQVDLDWLLKGPVRREDGRLAAWVEGGRPAYAYQESTGYLLSLLAYVHHLTGNTHYMEEAALSATALEKDVGKKQGCGRDGAVYLFDTAVCLRGLGRLNGQGSPTLVDRFSTTVSALLQSRRSVDPLGANPEKWSQMFGPHLFKAVHLASPWIDFNGNGAGTAQIAEELTQLLRRRGALSEHPEKRVYHHALCYAAEGLLGLRERGYHQLEKPLDEIVEVLASRQGLDGGIPRWWPDENQEAASDATAQAIRLWQALDSDRYAEAIRRGLDFLDRQSAPEGGVRYSSAVDHVNSWTTIIELMSIHKRLLAFERAFAGEPIEEPVIPAGDPEATTFTP